MRVIHGVNAKIMKVAYTSSAPACFVFVFSCLLAILVSYIENARNEALSDHSLRAVDDARFSRHGWR